jgi:hypothetical protein
MDFTNFVEKYTKNGKIYVIFSGIPVKTGEITKVKNKPFVLKTSDENISDENLQKFINKISKLKISELRALDITGKFLNSTQFKEPEVIKPPEGYKPTPHSTFSTLFREKSNNPALLPVESFTKLLEEQKEKALARQRSADANIIERIRNYYTQAQIKELTERERSRYLGLVNRVSSINQDDINNEQLGESVLDDIDLSSRSPENIKEQIVSEKKVVSDFTIDFGTECNICLMDMDLSEKLCKLNCKHTYHCECISKWLKVPISDHGSGIKGKCAVCREPVTKITTNEPRTSNFGRWSELKYLLSL